MKLLMFWSEVNKIRSLNKGVEFLRREWRKEVRNFQGGNKNLALSVAFGVFVGFTPTVGFHTIILYLFSRVFKIKFPGCLHRQLLPIRHSLANPAGLFLGL